MSIWGKLIGGAAGMALGGPIGAILGIAAGHGVDKVRKFDADESNKNFSNDQKEQIFATSVIAISAKLAKAGKLLTVAGGGDTVAALNVAEVTASFSYVSTAGGAFLEWLEGKELPGVSVLFES